NQWHQKFDEVVLSNGYLLNQADKCVYSKFDASDKGVIICLYVNDMLIFGTDQVQVDPTKEFLSSRFSMKDMWEADVILGIRIKHESNGIAIFQTHYIEKVLKKFNYSDCTPVITPLDTCEKLMPNRGLVVSQPEYSRVIGCLMYAMTCTRPDIEFAVGKLSSNTEDNSSTSGWVFLLDGGVIFWAFKKQTCITGPIIEYEVVALAAAGKEAEWLKNFLFEIPLWVKPMAPISICCDSAATLAKAYSQMYNGKSRHLGVRHSVIRELIMNGVVYIEFRAEAHVLQIIPRMCLEHALEHPIPAAPVPAHAGQQVAPEALAAHAEWNVGAYEMVRELKTLFAQQAEKELQTIAFRHPVTLGLRVSLILILLHKEFDGFMLNYNMHNMRKTINELHAILKLREQTLPKNNAHALHAIREGKVQKGNKKHKKPQPQLAARGQNQGKGKNKLAYAPKPKIPPPPRGKILPRTQSVINVLRQAIGRGTGLRGSRKLKPGTLSLYVGNDNSIQVSRNNMAYFSAIPRDGIFEIDLCDSYTYVSSMYALSNKKAKSNLDSALFWHCHLGHISKKHIEKLQYDRLLNSTGLRAFEKCVPLFQKEVENQLGKTIKLLRSDHEGEYMSQDFLDHLKDHGIIAHRTPYTPQQNGVSERRNRTLLDMVRPMMSQKTLPKSFWDYAFEITTHILNRVPTKKVEKTPYEV
nr:zinc finger, CCHC-type [Tanacetum cinerariifolium]